MLSLAKKHTASQSLRFLGASSARNKYVQIINGITFIDAVALEHSIKKNIPVKDRLRQKMINAGVEFWNEAQTIVKKPVVGISSVGGFSVSLEAPIGMIKLRMGSTTTGPITIPQSLADGLRETMGMQATHTYMNPHAKTPSELYETSVEHQHFSVAHAGTLGILILGLSKKAELEFDVQRDLVHLARETSARSAAQDEPTLVAMTAMGAVISEEILLNTSKILAKFKKEGHAFDWREERNALYSLSTSVSLGINGSLRNFQKLVADIGAQGKEQEYRNALALINDSLNGLFPELFKPTVSYAHQYPDSWRKASPSSAVPVDLSKEMAIIPAPNPDVFIPLDEESTITYKSNPDGHALRVVIITNNAKKFGEFCAQLGGGYGMEVYQWHIPEGGCLDETRAYVSIMQEQLCSPHFILREETSLIRRKDEAELTHLPLEEIAKRTLESVIHTSTLKVYKPRWILTTASEGRLQEKKLSGFTFRHYERRTYGYISPKGNAAVSKQGFGWDALFVNSATNLTNEEFYSKYGKKSARQHTISDFIETYLRYKALVTLKHHHLNIQRPIDFGRNFFHLSRFVQKEPHLSNPFIGDWGIEKLRSGVLNEGLFIKAAWSRPVKNYFSPPFSGCPLTSKKDDVEETIFMIHDILHHLICDLICDVEPSKIHLNLYSAWRMMSEACTIILADMLYADGLIKSGVDRASVDQRIYPLFEAIKVTQQWPDPHQMSNEVKIQLIKQLLFANVLYALLGDDHGFRVLLTETDGTLSSEHLTRLEAYKNHFKKFFIGDHVWTRANFDNMHKHRSSLQVWIASISKKTFRASQIPLMSDISEMLVAQNIIGSDYPSMVRGVFNIIFETKIRPHLERESVPLMDDEEIQSCAFRRFLIGQASLFARYPTPINLEGIKKDILLRIQNEAPFSHAEQEAIRLLIEQYILGLEGLRLMSREEALNAADCSTVFPPVYISYAAMEKKYSTIEQCVKPEKSSWDLLK